MLSTPPSPLRTVSSDIHSAKCRILCNSSARLRHSKIFACGDAKSSIEAGLSQYRAKQYEQALRRFNLALSLQPRPEEAQAAYYNAACCHVKLKNWREAAEAVSVAVNEYSLGLKVAEQDKDLAPLRERIEWKDASETMHGGVTQKTRIDLRTEQRSPFRLLRLILVSGLGIGAGVGLLIICSRLIAAVKGREGAPNVIETLQNFAINGAATAVLAFMFQRDLKLQKQDRAKIEREVALSRLQVKVGQDRIITLDSFRGKQSPVIVTGSTGQVSRAMKGALTFQERLQQKHIVVVPLSINASDPSAKLASLKQEFRKDSTAAVKRGFQSQFSKSTNAGTDLQKAGRPFELEPYNVAEWHSWLRDFKDNSIETGDQSFIKIQLDGSIELVEEGVPNWSRF